MLTMKDIIREGHNTLKQVATPVTLPITKDEIEILNAMHEYIRNSQDPELSTKYGLRPSVGIAAPQINISKRMLAIHTTDENSEKLYSYMLINPKIISHSEELTYLETGEGCLSIDREVPGVVPRYKRITVSAHLLDFNGDVTPVKLKFRDYVAIVMQHEIDHLNGILFTDRINKENPFQIDSHIQPIQFR